MSSSTILPVHEVWPPKGECYESNFNVIFFPGLQHGDIEQSWRNTWVLRDHPDICWPEIWLPEDLGKNIRVLLLDYGVALTRTNGRGNTEDVIDIGHNLNQSLVNSDEWSSGWNQPIALVGHSFGGLLIKSLVVEVETIAQKHPLGGNLLDQQFVARAQAFLRNVRGIVFYATPLFGLDMKKFLHFMEKAFVEVFGAAGIMKNMTILSKPAGVLSRDFENVVQKYNISVYAFLEGRPEFGLGTYVVPPAAAFQHSNCNYYKVEDAMHEEVCQPPSKEHPSYQKLLENLKVFRKQVRGEKSGASIAIATTESTYYEIPSLQVSQYVVRVELLEKIKKLFNTPRIGSRPNIVVLSGMGGQGKTQLALEYCRATKLSRFQAIFWLDASSPKTISRGFEIITERISSSGRVFENIESKISFVKDTLEGWQFPWLIVFDNYDQPSEFRDITSYLPRGGIGSILFTSRHADIERLGIIIKVNQMTEDESLELLLRQSKQERNDNNIVEGKMIVQKLGYLPLAVDQAGVYISVRHLPLRLFKKHYEEQMESMFKYTPSLWEYLKKLGDDKEETLLNVFTTCELSYQQISKNDDERIMVSHLLTLSAFIDATNVGEDMFKSYFDSTNQTPQWMEHFIVQGVWDHYKYQDIIMKFSSLSLLQVMDVESAESHFALHPLITDWLKLRIGQKCREKYIIEAKTIIMKYIIGQDQDSLSLSKKQYILSHLDACLQNDQKNNLWGLDEYVITSSRSAFIFANFYLDQGRYQDAETMYERAMAGYEKALGPEHTSTLTTVNNFGYLYQSQGKLTEAEAMYERALAGYEKTLGPEHTLTLTTVNNLGNLYQSQGKLTEAEAMYERALAGYEKALGPKHTLTLTTDYNLGNLYQSQGKLTEAEAMYELALAGYEKALGPKHTLTLTTVNNLGNFYLSQGKLVEAEAMYERALAGYEKALGPKHTSTLDTINNLGNLYQSQGKAMEAEAMYKQALTGYEKALGSKLVSTLTMVKKLGNLYQFQGKLAEAEAMYERALTGYKKALGSEHTSTLDTVNSLGNIYQSQGKLAEAKAMYERALTGYEKALGSEHTSTLTIVNNLGNLYESQGKLVKAEAMYEQTLAGYKKALGPEHMSTLTTIKNLGNLNQFQGKLVEAEAMYKQALMGCEKAIGPEHTSMLDTFNNLVNLYQSQGKLAKTKAMYERALAGYEKALEPKHTSTLDTINNLDNLYHFQGKLAEAQVVYGRALAKYNKALGPKYTSTLTKVHNLDMLYESQGKVAEEAMYGRALVGMEKTLGPDIENFACVGGTDVLVLYPSAQHLSPKNHHKVEDVEYKTVCMPFSKEAPNNNKMLDMLIVKPVLDQTHVCSTQDVYVEHQQRHKQDQSAPPSSKLSKKIVSANHPFCNISLASLCQELNRINTIIGINEPPMLVKSILSLNEFFEEHHRQNPGMNIVASRPLSSTIPNQKLQFLFRDAKSMAQVVGIGLSHAFATVNQSLAIEVVGIPKDDWEQLWNEARQEKKILNISQQDVNGDILMERGFSGQVMAQKFGVGSDHSKLQTITRKYNDGHMRGAEVLLLTLSKYLLLKEILVTENDIPSIDQSGRYDVSFPENIGLQWSLSLWGGLWNNFFTGANGLGSSGGRTEDGSSSQDSARGSDHGQGGNVGGDNGGRDNRGDDFGGGADEASIVEVVDIDEDVTAIVDVYPGFGGHWNGLEETEDLKGCNIYPTLRFEFKRSKAWGEVTVGVVVRFELGRKTKPKSKKVEECRFGWFQNNLNIALTSMIEGAAALDVNHHVLDELDISKTTLKASSSSTTNPLRISLEGAVTGKVPPFIDVRGKFGVTKAIKSSKIQLMEMANEMITKQMCGGFNSLCGCTTSELAYEFVFPYIPKDQVIHDEQVRNLYISSGICNTVCPGVFGKWHQLDSSEASKYTFCASRTFSEFIADKKSMVYDGKEFIQEYNVDMFVNHAMTHICRFKGPENLREGEKNDLMEVCTRERERRVLP